MNKAISLGLLVSGLGVFWFAAAFGMVHYIHNGLAAGLVVSAALLVACSGYVLLKYDSIARPVKVLGSILVFLSLNCFLFEISLYFNPYPNYWWTRQAADWIALIGLGNIITNELVFEISFLILATRVVLDIQRKITFRRIGLPKFLQKTVESRNVESTFPAVAIRPNPVYAQLIKNRSC